MESPRSSSLSFYDLTGAAIPGPVEGDNCGIAIAVPKALSPSILLKLGASPLPFWENEVSVYSEWPPCGPGYYELSLECDTIIERRTVTVMPRFFSQNDFAFLIHDLTDVLPLTLAHQLNMCGAQLGTLPARDQKTSIEEEYLKLCAAIVGTKEKLGILQILPILQQNCHTTLIPKLELRSVEKARRPDISKLPQAISIPGNVVSSTKIYQMFDVTSERSFESYENRLVKAYVLALRSRLARLQAKLKSELAPDAMSVQLDVLASEFHLAFMRASFLRSIRNATVSSVRITMVLLKNPAYRAVFEGYLSLNEQSTVALEEPALSYPLNNFPYLYQRWVSLKILAVMLQVCAESGYRCVSHHWIKYSRRSVNIHSMNDGFPAVQLACPTTGRLVSFIPWTIAPSVAGQESPMHLAITIETQGKPTTILLFDPRYWVDSKNVGKKSKKSNAKTDASGNGVAQMLSSVEPRKEDVDELLRFREQVKAMNAMSEIPYSAILYPGKKKHLAPDVEALTAHTSDGDGLDKAVFEVLRRYLS